MCRWALLMLLGLAQGYKLILVVPDGEGAGEAGETEALPSLRSKRLPSVSAHQLVFDGYSTTLIPLGKRGSAQREGLTGDELADDLALWRGGSGAMAFGKRLSLPGLSPPCRFRFLCQNEVTCFAKWTGLGMMMGEVEEREETKRSGSESSSAAADLANALNAWAVAGKRSGDSRALLRANLLRGKSVDEALSAVESQLGSLRSVDRKEGEVGGGWRGKRHRFYALGKKRVVLRGSKKSSSKRWRFNAMGKRDEEEEAVETTKERIQDGKRSGGSESVDLSCSLDSDGELRCQLPDSLVKIGPKEATASKRKKSGQAMRRILGGMRWMRVEKKNGGEDGDDDVQVVVLPKSAVKTLSSKAKRPKNRARVLLG